MPQRLSALFASAGRATVPRLPPFATALKEALAEGYDGARLRADAMAGLVVGVVALPLSMALAIASGVAPQHGLATAIVAGTAVALLGGSHVQVSGPTAAFVVLLAPIAGAYGLGGLLLAGLMAGLLLILLAVARMGRLISFVPLPVTAGFTAGIAFVIAVLQVKDALGLTTGPLPNEFLERVGVLATALPTARWEDGVIAGLTLGTLLLWPRLPRLLGAPGQGGSRRLAEGLTRNVPGPLVALVLATLAAVALTRLVPGFEVATIASRFGGIPAAPPLPALPWSFPGADGEPLGLRWSLVRELAPSAFAIAMLAAIESLLSATIADGMTGRKHDPDAEILALGVGNLLVPFFGGIAATGALARTATNVRSGATSPIASVVHAAFVLAAMVALAPLLGYLPMAALAGLLLLVAWNMSEARHVVHTLRVAPRSDSLVLVACLVLTVVFDMVVSVTFGVMLAALLFMRRMAEVSGTRILDVEAGHAHRPPPPGTVVYEIAGPLFFGAAQRAMGALDTIAAGTRCVVLDVESVPVIDATGLTNLDSAIRRLSVPVVLVGVQPQPAEVLVRAGLGDAHGRVRWAPSLEQGLRVAEELTAP